MRLAHALDLVRERCGARRFYALLVFLPSAALVLLGAWALARSARESALAHLHGEQTLAVQLGILSLMDELETSRHGLDVLARRPSLQRAIDDPSSANRSALARDAVALSETLGVYEKVRWIDENGQERMRVDWEGNRAAPVPDALLQNKASRYFVRDTKSLPMGSVYVSPLDLNVDYGRLEVPYQPTLRYARALFDGTGRRRGILLVNVLAKPMLDAFSAVGLKLNDDLMLVNTDGYWLSSGNPEDDFAFMFGRNRSLAQRYPQAWRLMRSQPNGQDRLASGLWTWSTLRPYHAHVLTSAGSGSLTGPSPGGLLRANTRPWIAATRAAPQKLALIEARATRPYAGTAALLIAALAGLSAVVGRALEGRQRAMEGRQEALEDRQRAVEQLQLLAENAADVVFRSSAEGILEWISPSAQSLLGFAPEELLGLRGPDLIVPEDLPRFQEAHQEVLAGRKAVFEARFRTADHGRRWLAVSIRPLLDHQGQLIGRAGNWRDIQDEMEARQARAESEQRFQLAMDNAPVGMALVRPGGQFMQVNPALCAILGRDADNLLTCAWQILSHPDDRAKDEQLLEQLKAGAIASYRLRKRFLRPDGAVVWGDLAVAPIRHPDGGLQLLIKQVQDISETVLAQKELEARKEQYRLLAENASDVVLLTDHDHRLRWLSPSATELFGNASDDLIGTAFDSWVHPDDLPRLNLIRRQLAVYSTAMRPHQGQVMRLAHPGGSYRWVAVRMRLLTDRGGSVVGEVLALRDVDDLVEARRRLENEQQFLRATLDSLLDPHLTLEPVYDDDDQLVDFICADANKACLHAMAIDRGLLIGSRLSTLMPAVIERGLMAQYVAVFQSGESLLLDDFHFPNLETPDGDHRYDFRVARAADLLTVTWRDVTQRYEQVERLALSEERYRLLAENATDLVLRIKENELTWVSNTAPDILGAPPEHWIGKGIDALLPPEELSSYLADLMALHNGSMVTRRLRLITADGSQHWFSMHARQFRNAQGEPDGISASLRNIDAEVAVSAELDYRARHDQLTGLLNRSEALPGIEAQIAQEDHRKGRTAVLFIDVDKFKQVNDCYGHAAGDAVLQTLARRLRDCTREGDLVARLGGDELLVSLPGLHRLEEALAVAEKIRMAGAEPVDAQGRAIQTTLSIGVVLAEPGESIDDLIARADRAMYRAKQGGRNQVIPIEGN